MASRVFIPFAALNITGNFRVILVCIVTAASLIHLMKRGCHPYWTVIL